LIENINDFWKHIYGVNYGRTTKKSTIDGSKEYG
jgi:hypothetical protein